MIGFLLHLLTAIYPKYRSFFQALRLVHDLADDFLKFSAKWEKKKKEGEKKKKEREKKREEKKERKIAIIIKETVGKVISIHKS